MTHLIYSYLSCYSSVLLPSVLSFLFKW
ncbi:hypothetical protein Avbf_16069 [Armadillidium vulgare]|nr:hypothetical protein Avbf_16069 [Armadillidium vulgare]